jgi:hypothetical protein
MFVQRVRPLEASANDRPRERPYNDLELVAEETTLLSVTKHCMSSLGRGQHRCDQEPVGDVEQDAAGLQARRQVLHHEPSAARGLGLYASSDRISDEHERHSLRILACRLRLERLDRHYGTSPSCTRHLSSASALSIVRIDRATGFPFRSSMSASLRLTQEHTLRSRDPMMDRFLVACYQASFVESITAQSVAGGLSKISIEGHSPQSDFPVDVDERGYKR